MRPDLSLELTRVAKPPLAARLQRQASQEPPFAPGRTLTVNDVVKDYDAVMTSVEHLKTVWPGSKWPEGLTFEQDLIDLG